MAFNIKKAVRELIWVKLALMGASGSGKTYSALRLAKGMKEELEKRGEKDVKILLGNTEQARGRYYANEFEYDIVDITSPHAPEMYVEFIEFAVANGYKILILDSSSHEWEGKGGCLDLHQQFGGTFQSWAKVTPRHDKFIQSIADSPIHMIVTMRGKDQYEIEKGESGKNTVKKLGVGAKQRDGFEYEFTATFLLDQQDNMAKVQKDNTHLFEKEGAVILTEKHGSKVIEWANSGKGYTPPVRESKSSQESLQEVSDKVLEICKQVGSDNKDFMKIITDSTGGSKNPNKIKELSKMQELYAKLVEFKSKLPKVEEEKESE